MLETIVHTFIMSTVEAVDSCYSLSFMLTNKQAPDCPECAYTFVSGREREIRHRTV